MVEDFVPPVRTESQHLETVRQKFTDVVALFQSQSENETDRPKKNSVELDTMPDVDSLSALEDLPFEVQAIQWTDRRGDVPVSHVICGTSWIEDAVDEVMPVEAQFGDRSQLKELIKEGVVSVDVVVHNHPHSENVSDDVVKWPSFADLESVAELDLIVSRFGITAFRPTQLTISELLATLPESATRRARPYVDKLGGVQVPSTQLARIPYFDSFLFEAVMAKSGLRILGPERSELVALFEKERGFQKKLAIELFQVPAILLPRNQVPSMDTLRSMDIPAFSFNHNDEDSVFIRTLSDFIARQNAGEKFDELNFAPQSLLPDEAFFEAMAYQDRTRKNIRYQCGGEVYIVTEKTLSDLWSDEPAQPSDILVEPSFTEDRELFALKIAKKSLAEGTHFFEFNGWNHRVDPARVRAVIEAARVSD